LHTLQSVEPDDFDPEQQERLHARRLEFAESYNLDELADEAFSALSAQGSAVGYYLRALKMSGLPDSGKNLATGSLNPLRRALKYLKGNQAAIAHDTRCLDLMLDLSWMVSTRTKFFEKERQALPLDSAQWRECFNTLVALEEIGETQRPMLVAFVRGLAVFHLGDIDQSIDVFREIERISDRIRGRKRVIRSYVASTPEGLPRKFHGSVAWVSAEGRRGEVYVEELRRKILFFPRDFARPEIGAGDTLGEFHVAFNFLGLIADPTEYYKS
jgi:hypothetical protein